jgi:hypothetical protein
MYVREGPILEFRDFHEIRILQEGGREGRDKRGRKGER